LRVVKKKPKTDKDQRKLESKGGQKGVREANLKEMPKSRIGKRDHNGKGTSQRMEGGGRRQILGGPVGRRGEQGRVAGRATLFSTNDIKRKNTTRVKGRGGKHGRARKCREDGLSIDKMEEIIWKRKEKKVP